MSRRRFAIGFAGGAAIALLLLTLTLVVFTQTDWGREQVRRFTVARLNDVADGEVVIRKLEGNLLSRPRLVDVSIVDAQGRPFVRADTIVTAFSLRSLLLRRLIFEDMRMVRAEVVLDKPPGEDWNWVRIFPSEPVVGPPRRRRWGHWLEFNDAVLVDSHLTVQTAWEPGEDLSAEERQETIERVLSGRSRENVVEVPGGYQNVMHFRDLNAALPHVLVAHPDREGIPIEIARFAGVIQPYRPPAAVVLDLSGKARLARDSLTFDDMRAVLPGSNLAIEGVYSLDSGDLLLRLRGEPLAFADLEWLYPRLPEEGGGTLSLTVHRRTVATRLIGSDMDLRVGESTLQGEMDITLGDSVRLRETDIRFARVETRLLEQVIPGLEMPRHGRLTGELELAGTPAAMRLDGDVTFDDETAGRSRVLAVGELGVEPEIRFRDLRLRFDPLQAELARLVVPQLPMRGTIVGFANLTGSSEGPLQLVSDLTLRDPRAGRSRVRAAGGIDMRDELRLQNLRLSLDPLRLDLLRDEVPGLPAGGSLAGTILLDGFPRRALAVDGDLTLRDPRTGVSRIAAVGGLAFEDELRFRDLRLRFDPLQLDLARDWVPDLPAGATILGRARLDGVPARHLTVDGDLTIQDPATGTSRVAAVGGVRTAGGLAFEDLRLRFAPLRLNLVRTWLPDLPEAATVSGPLRLDGSPAGILAVDGDLTLNDPASGESRIHAVGGLEFRDRLEFHAMRIDAGPLQLDLLRPWLPELPAGARVFGGARLDGAPERHLRVDGELTVLDPGTGTSRLSAVGGIRTAGGLAFDDLRLRFDPLQLNLARTWLPELPAAATLSGPLRLDGSPRGLLDVDGDLTLDDPETGRSHVHAAGRLALGDRVEFRSFRVEAGPLRLDLLSPWFPELPAGARVFGQARLDGAPERMLHVDGEATVLDPVSGDSRFAASGGIRTAGGFAFDDLRVRMEPLRMQLVQAFAPDFPLGGVLTGRATLDGAPSARLAVHGDVEHREDGEHSRVTGQVVWVPGAQGWASVDVSLLPLSLDVAGRFMPAAGLRGTVSGSLQAQGNLRELALNADLAVAGGGEIAARGTLDLASATPGYDVAATMRDFDMAAVTTRAPASTALTGTARASGRGVDPATMRMNLVTDLSGPRIDGIGVDELRLRLAIADGLATVDSSIARVARTEAVVHGTFGLVAGREGTLRYRVRSESLEAFAGWVERTDSAVAGLGGRRVARDLPLDSIAGSLFAEGELRGNTRRFDAEGRAEAENLVLQGFAVGSGTASYTLAGIGTEAAHVELDTDMARVRAAGFAFDTLAARLRYDGGRSGFGHLALEATGDNDTAVRADADFVLSLDRNEIGLRDLALRVDTVTWETARPAVVSWGSEGIEVHTLELASNVGGRIQVDGRLPVDGSADLDVLVEDLEIGHVLALLQEEEEATGRLTLQGRLRGTRADPSFTGTAQLLDASRGGDVIPDVRGTFTYAARELTLDAELSHDGRFLAMARGTVPIDLSLTSVAGSRLIDGPLALDIRADSLPLDALPGFGEHVDEVRGRVAGDLAVRGTFSEPRLTGAVDVDLATLRVVPLGITFEEIAGTIRLQDDVASIDSLSAWSRGPIRISGEMGIRRFLEPSFDLQIATTDALVIDTDHARLRVDADLTVTGPFTEIAIEGDVQTRSGVIYIPELADFGGGDVVNLDDPGTFARVDTLLHAERDALLRRSPILEQLQVDLAVFIDRDVWLRSREANVEIYTPVEVGPLRVRLDGDAGRFALEGTINTDRGEYEFMSRRFVLSRGAATFVDEPEFNPLLQVAAGHEVRLPGREAIEIRVVLDGTLRDLSITLESTAQPPIAQTHLLSYLAFGRDASSLLQQQGSALSGEGVLSGGLVGNVAGLATQQLAAIALEEIFDEVERDAMRELRLDVFRITPADLPPELFTGSYLDAVRGTEIEAGRYLRPRLFVSAQARADDPVPGLRVEYSTPDGFQWVTSWRPRLLAPEPTLAAPEPERTRVFGSFLFREWRF